MRENVLNRLKTAFVFISIVNKRFWKEKKRIIMKKTPKMSEEMYNALKGLFTHILLNANDEQAQLIADCIAALCDREITKIEKEIELENPKVLN